MRRRTLISDASDVLIASDVACISLIIFMELSQICSDYGNVYAFHVVCKCDVFVFVDVCGSFVFVECSLFLLSMYCMRYEKVEWVCGMFLSDM